MTNDNGDPPPICSISASTWFSSSASISSCTHEAETGGQASGRSRLV